MKAVSNEVDKRTVESLSPIISFCQNLLISSSKVNHQAVDATTTMHTLPWAWAPLHKYGCQVFIKLLRFQKEIFWLSHSTFPFSTSLIKKSWSTAFLQSHFLIDYKYEVFTVSSNAI